MNEKTIFKHMGSTSSKYSLYFEEKYDEEEKTVVIEAKMKFDMTSKAAKEKLNKAWAKDKSPLLLELQKLFREHEKNKREGQEGMWYKPME